VRAHLIPFPAGGGAAAPPAGSTATCRLDAADGSGWLLALTDTEDAAAYEVEHVAAHSHGAGSTAAVVEFPGPRDAAQVAADQRSSRDRVGPAAMQVPGNLGALVLRAGDGAMVAVAFADSPATLEASARAILSTPLLPGEDPALLGGPQRSTTCRVVGDDIAAFLRRTGAEVRA
jgi:hypothetical protein